MVEVVIRDILGNDFNCVNLKVVMELRVGYKPRSISNETDDLVLSSLDDFQIRFSSCSPNLYSVRPSKFEYHIVYEPLIGKTQF